MDYELIFNALLNIGLSEKELEKEIHKKEAEFGGYITLEGILFLLAKEYGLPLSADDSEIHFAQKIEQEIDYDEFLIPLGEVKDNMSKIVVAGRIEKIYEKKEFIRKDLSQGKIGSFLLNDGTKCLKIILWDDQTTILDQKYFQVSEFIRIIGGFSKQNQGTKEIEIHLSKKGKISFITSINTLNRFPLLKELCSPSFPNNFFSNNNLISISGNVNKIIKFQEKDKAGGGKTFILRFEVESEQGFLTVNVFGMSAVQVLEQIREGMKICLSNLIKKYNSYSQQEELYYFKNSVLKII